MVSDETHIEGLNDFDEHSELFQQLTKRYHIATDHMDLIEMAITYDSRHAIAICKNNDLKFQIKGVNLLNFEPCFHNEINGEFLRMNVIEQNLAGEIMAIAYQDDGVFYVRILDNKGKTIENLNVSDIIGTDNRSKPIEGINEPLISCVFIENDDLFISAYHRPEKKQYHFTYSYKLKS